MALRGNAATNDEKTKEAAVAYLNNSLTSSDKSATVVHFGNLDAVVQSMYNGWCSNTYLQAVQRLDTQVCIHW